MSRLKWDRLLGEIVEGCLSFALVVAAVFFLMLGLALWHWNHEVQTLEQKWESMCAGPERYDAMREAADKGKPNPC